MSKRQSFIIVSCVVCDRDFNANRSTAKYCSSKCKSSAARNRRSAVIGVRGAQLTFEDHEFYARMSKEVQKTYSDESFDKFVLACHYTYEHFNADTYRAFLTVAEHMMQLDQNSEWINAQYYAMLEYRYTYNYS